jgi:hypothetical protein
MDNRGERSADRISGLFWIAFGLVVIWLSVSMEIRRHLGATFLNGPGFAPMLLGGALCLLGSVLVVRSSYKDVIGFFDAPGSVSGRNALIALGLMLVYSLGLIGRMPFGLATFLFISVFIVVFNLPVEGRRQLGKLIAKAVVTAALTAYVVVEVFHRLFYVRLP